MILPLLRATSTLAIKQNIRNFSRISSASSLKFFSTSNVDSRVDMMNKFNVLNGVTTKLPLITKCRKDGFDVANVKLKGGIILLDGGIFLWDVSKHSDLNTEALKIFQAVKHDADLLLIGTGKEMKPLPEEIVNYIKECGMQVEVFSSKNACSTYNILVEEDRRVAVALLPQKPVSAREFNSPETDEDKLSLNIIVDK